MKDPLVSVNWLKDHLEDENLIILDASLQTDKKSVSSVIPGAIWFDLKGKFSDPTSAFPNTFPSVQQFVTEARNLGINNNSTIVVYDTKGIFSAPRVWWMFRIMGHQNVAVLNGGLPAWLEAGLPTQKKHTVAPKNGNFEAAPNLNSVKSIDEIEANIEKNNYQVVDARSKGRFNGTEAEPREELKSGHIPNSINIPYTQLLENGYYKPLPEIKQIFNSSMINNKPIIFSCGSGITACVLLLGAQLVLKNELNIYDGSWTEWATIHADLL